MTTPPSIMRLRIRRGNRNFRLCIPLCLFLLPVMLFVLLLSPLILLAAVVLWYNGLGRPILLLIPALYRFFCALRGLELNVDRGSEQIFISFR